MLITEMIAKLIELKDNHGDKEVFLVQGCGCCDQPFEMGPRNISFHKGFRLERDEEKNYKREGIIFGPID